MSAKAKVKEELAIECPTFGQQVDPNHPACRICVSKHPEYADACYQKTQESAAPKRAARKSSGTRKKSDSVQFLLDAVKAACFTRPQIIEGYMIAFPEKAKSTVTTYLSDCMNPKYYGRTFPEIVVTDKATGIMHYEAAPIIFPDYETVLKIASEKAAAAKKAAEKVVEDEKAAVADAPKEEKKSSKKKAKKK